jgi:hypothetical protein
MDPIIKTSTEVPFDIIQTLNIARMEVLMLYDSGASNNLVNNRASFESGFHC